MADAKKCDSCGVYWDGGFADIAENEIIVGSTTPEKIGGVHLAIKGDGYYKELDLCGPCIRGFGMRNRSAELPWTKT